MMRTLFLLLVLALASLGGLYFVAGRAEGPTIEIVRPGALVGANSELELVVTSPDGQITSLVATLEHQGGAIGLFALDAPVDATIEQAAADRIRITRPFGRDTHPELTPGSGILTVSAERPVLFGLRRAGSTVTREVELRFDPPRLAVASTHHFINHAGSEMIVYRVTPTDVDSGVRVGERRYPGYPAAGAGLDGADPSLRVAFFALLHDQDLRTPMELFAEDAAGNVGRASFDHRVFPKPFRRSRIEIGDDFIARVVPDIAARTPELGLSWSGDPEGAVEAFLEVNGRLREINAETIAGLADETAPELLWDGAFQQLGGSQVESGFADHRTYLHDGEEIDQQIHLGFDLASTAAVAVEAANRGRVVHAAYLGIYGNCVILDHGMGLQSLYGHLSSIEVRTGDQVAKGQTLGRTGTTGLAGGDHLHFTTLLNGRPVNPVEWWDPHWIEDRILRKLREAGGGP